MLFASNHMKLFFIYLYRTNVIPHHIYKSRDTYYYSNPSLSIQNAIPSNESKINNDSSSFYANCPSEFWSDTTNQRKFADWAASELNVKDKSDWYKISFKVHFPSFFQLKNQRTFEMLEVQNYYRNIIILHYKC